MSIDEQNSYVQGLEDMYNIIKSILELPSDKRQERFGAVLIADIMDKFDFQQIRELMVERLEKKYVIRGIKENDYGQKKVAVESDPLSVEPDEILINAFLNCHKDKHIQFAVVETIYTRG